ncbi:MAG TPA: hypothetical protein ENJ09_12710, partial [Planctomycetes bacterium]|nr:hypothetical protein [Planctomycetota bacterium]
MPTRRTRADGGGPAHPDRSDESPSPLPPAISAALDEGVGDLDAQLFAIRDRSPGRSRYKLLGEVGTGGMGRVLRVWDESLQRELAMKVLFEEDDEDPAERRRRLRRFLGEARVTGQLDHPGIVPVHDLAMDEEGRLYFTMPLVRGKTLAEVFRLARKEREGWTLRRAVDLLQRVCMTVAFAHSRGVIHRDLKPDNVMVGPFGEALVMDWGLSLVGERTASGRVVGTPAYMAPEQFTDPTSASPRSDIYSLGAILYELLVGCVPHERTMEESPDASGLAEFLRRPPRSIHTLGEEAPEELAAICSKAMAAKPKDRYASARDLADDITAWLEHRVVKAARTGTWARIRKWRERNRGLSHALEALVLVALIATTVISLLQRNRIRTVQAKNREIEAGTYTANLHSASLHLRNLEVNDARIRLGECPPALRDFEWGFLDYLSDSSERILTPIESSILVVAASGDGRFLVAGSAEGALHIFDGLGNELASAGPLRGPVHSLQFLPGTPLFLTATRGGAVTLWNAETARRVRSLSVGSGSIMALAVSPNADLIAIGLASGEVRLLHSSDDSVAFVLRSSDGPVSALGFSVRGAFLAVGYSSGYVTTWNLDERRRVHRVLLGDAPVHCIAYTPNGRELLCAVGPRVLALSAADLEPGMQFQGHAGAVSSIDVDPPHRMLTSSLDGTIRLWDLATGTESARLSGHLDEVNTAVFLADGHHLLS